MGEGEKQPCDVTAFEAALASLAPQVGQFDRDRLLFLAGRASATRDAGTGTARRTGWRWPAATAAMTAVAACLLVMLCTRPGTQSPVAQTAAASEEPICLDLREQMLRQQVEFYEPAQLSAALAAVAQGPLPYHELIERLLADQRFRGG